jgi:hypothetical protein
LAGVVLDGEPAGCRDRVFQRLVVSRFGDSYNSTKQHNRLVQAIRCAARNSSQPMTNGRLSCLLLSSVQPQLIQILISATKEKQCLIETPPGAAEADILATFAQVEVPTDQELSVLYLHLLQLCLVYVNTLMIQRILAGKAWFMRIGERELRVLSPLVYSHINPYGRFELDMEARLPIDA